MKKFLLTLGVAVVVSVAAFWASVWCLNPRTEVVSEPPVHDYEEEIQVEPVEGIQQYDNGMSEFTYDSSKIVWQEMPSSDESGYPMTSFLLKESDDVLPRLDVVPLELTEPFSNEITTNDWQGLVKAFMLAYYNTNEQSLVDLSFADAVVKVEDGSAKMYVYITTSLEGSATPDMNGVVRLIANKDNAVMTFALVKKGASIPKEIEDVYMSVELY